VTFKYEFHSTTTVFRSPSSPRTDRYVFPCCLIFKCQHVSLLQNVICQSSASEVASLLTTVMCPSVYTIVYALRQALTLTAVRFGILKKCKHTPLPPPPTRTQYNGKDKISSVQVLKSSGSGGKAPLVPNLGTRCSVASVRN
jgi:hypothetical protein